MLRASSETHEQDINLDAIMDGSDTGDIVFGAELAAFAEAVVLGEGDELSDAREQLIKVAGFRVLVDAAGVASNFQRMTRIADSTGIILGAFDEETASLRESLGINDFRKRSG